jgi:FkbM family methyltransferase
MGLYEFDKQRFVAKQLRQGSIFFDIGANAGFYTLLAAQTAKRVYAFEPLPTNLEFLRRHLSLNNVENVEIIEAAVCDEVGTACFRVEKNSYMGALNPEGSIQVRTVTLDHALKSSAVCPPDFVKMDIEGAELRALLGAEHTIRSYKPVLFLATHGVEMHRQCCELLRAWGYHVSNLDVTVNAHFEVFATAASS